MTPRTHSRLRRTLAILAATSALALTGCDGGDASPNAPAEDAGAGTAGVGTDGMGEQNQPSPGNPGLPDTGDDLESPTPTDG